MVIIFPLFISFQSPPLVLLHLNFFTLRLIPLLTVLCPCYSLSYLLAPFQIFHFVLVLPFLPFSPLAAIFFCSISFYRHYSSLYFCFLSLLCPCYSYSRFWFHCPHVLFSRFISVSSLILLFLFLAIFSVSLLVPVSPCSSISNTSFYPCASLSHFKLKHFLSSHFISAYFPFILLFTGSLVFCHSISFLPSLPMFPFLSFHLNLPLNLVPICSFLCSCYPLSLSLLPRHLIVYILSKSLFPPADSTSPISPPTRHNGKRTRMHPAREEETIDSDA